MKETRSDVPEKDQVGGTWPNTSDSKTGAHSTGRTGPIDDVNRDEYDEPGENAAVNEPESSVKKPR